ncbi:MAG: nucleotidyltransferase domain-containing protein [Thermodesulfobacteriota bacterium]
MVENKLPKAVQLALMELKQSLAEVYGARLSGIHLFGSYACGDFQPDSDVDILIAPEGMVNPGKEINRVSERVSDICLEYDVLIAIFPVTEDWLQVRKSPLFENVRREGVPL